MVRDRSSEVVDDADGCQPAGGDTGVGNRCLVVVVLACVGSRLVPPFVGRCTKPSTPDSNIGAARRACATLLDRLALVMVGLGLCLGSKAPKLQNDERIRSFRKSSTIAMAGPDRCRKKRRKDHFRDY